MYFLFQSGEAAARARETTAGNAPEPRQREQLLSSCCDGVADGVGRQREPQLEGMAAHTRRGGWTVAEGCVFVCCVRVCVCVCEGWVYIYISEEGGYSCG